MKQPLRSFCWFATLNAVFGLCFLGIYILVRQLNQDPIVFSQGNRVVGCCATAYFSGVLLALRFLKPPQIISSVLMPSVFSFIFLGYSFIVTIPSLLDRSISIYVISTVVQAGPDGIPLNQIQDIFVRGYIGGETTVKKRLHEQIVLHHIELKDDRYVATPTGRFVHDTNLFLGRLLNIPTTYIIALNARPPQKAE